MIIEENGRAWSTRTLNEQLELLQHDLKSLSPEERETLILALKELENPVAVKPDAPVIPTLLDTFAHSEWEHEPVDIETFVKDEYYLGKTCDNLYPKLLEDMKELFSGGYHECVLTGSIGYGKCLTTASSYVNPLSNNRRFLANMVGRVPLVPSLTAEGVSIRGASRVWYAGKKPSMRLHLDNGHVLEASADHPVLTRIGYVPVSLLDRGDEVAVSRRDGFSRAWGWARVKRLCDIGEREVIDLTVPGTQNAVVDGVVVHNTFFASIGVCRVLYELSCMRDPQKSYGLAAGSVIAITCFSVNEMLAMKVVFENITNKLQASPYFKEHFPYEITKKEMRFPSKKLWLAARASTDSSALGLNTITALVDECVFKDAEVLLANGSTARVEDLCKVGEVVVQTFDFQKSVSVSAQAFIKRSSDQACFELELLSGETLRCSGNHPVAVRQEDGTYAFRLTRDLGLGDYLVTFGCDPDGDAGFVTAPSLAIRPRGSLDAVLEGMHLGVRGVGRVLGVSRLVTVRPMGVCPTYDVSVPGYEVFVADGVLVHNTNFMPDVPKGMRGRMGSEIQGRAQSIYNTIKRRMKSRFSRQGQLPGMLFIVSSKRTKDDFTAKLLRSMKNDSSMFARDYCLTGDTKVSLVDGTVVTLRSLAECYEESEERFEVYACDVQTGQVVTGRAHHPRLTARNESVVRVTLEGGASVRATPWHPFLLRSGSYCRADALRPGDALMSRTSLDAEGTGHQGVVSVVVEGTENVYDLSVEHYENFALECGVFVHNSQWAVRPEEFFLAAKFPVLCGNESTPSRILTADEAAALRSKDLDEGLVILDVPEDFRTDFENDIEGCFTGDTQVSLLDGREVSIQDLCAEAEFGVYAFGADGRVYPGRGHSARRTHVDAEIVEVELDSGACVRCTPDHLFMLRDGTYEPAGRLRLGTGLMPRVRQAAFVRSVRSAGRADVYDITVDTHHNFSLTAGVVVHNSIRDIGGISTVSLSPFIQRREKLIEAVDARLAHPFSTMEYEIGSTATFEWGRMVRSIKNHHGELAWQPLINPAQPRHVHIDPSLTGDCTGLVMAHIAGMKDVARRKDGKQHTERLPIYLVDLVLRVRPPLAGEIDLGDVRQLLYMLRDHGYRIMQLTMDRYNSADTLQQVRKKGIKADLLSVDLKPEPYEHMKTAFYEGRIVMYDYPPLLQELQQLEKNHAKNKIDHPTMGCFVGSTRIPLVDGTFPQISDLVGQEVVVYAARSENVIVPGKARGRLTRFVTQLTDVVLDSGAVERCTPEHRWMLRDGSYCEAQRLRPGVDYVRSRTPQPGSCGIRAVLPVELATSVPVYDLEVEVWSNFALASGAFVHNSKDLSDALAGTLYSLSKTRGTGSVLPIMPGMSYAPQDATPAQMGYGADRGLSILIGSGASDYLDDDGWSDL